MTNKELIEALGKYDPDKEVVVFVAGEMFPTLDVQELVEFGDDKRIEIGCGWVALNDDE